MTTSQRRYHELDIRPGMRVQVNGYAAPATVTAVGEWDSPAWEGGRRLGNRKVWGVLDCDYVDHENPAPREMDDADILAAWSPESGYGDDFVATQAFSNLYLRTLDQQHHERTAGYWYTVTAGAISHVAFATRDQLLSWMAERGLRLTADLPEQGVSSGQNIAGSYRVACVPHTLGFNDIDGVRTREMCNGRWTAATITVDADGVRTVHKANPNCRAREEFDGHVWPAPQEDHYFYVPGQTNVVDEVWIRPADGVKVGLFSKATATELRNKHPGLIMCAESEVRARANAAACTAPIEITKAVFQDMLYALPPQGWTDRGDRESFKFAEYYSNDVTSIYARIGERYFTFKGLGTLSHDQVMAKIEHSGLLSAAAPEDEPAGMAP